MTDILTVTQTQVVEAMASKPDRCAKRIYHKDSDIDGSYYIREDIHEAELTKLRNALDVAEKALSELFALVQGECPSLLNDDSGGDAQLNMDIQEALTTIKQAKEQ